MGRSPILIFQKMKRDVGTQVPRLEPCGIAPLMGSCLPRIFVDAAFDLKKCSDFTADNPSVEPKQNNFSLGSLIRIEFACASNEAVCINELEMYC